MTNIPVSLKPATADIRQKSSISVEKLIYDKYSDDGGTINADITAHIIDTARTVCEQKIFLIFFKINSPAFFI